MFFSLTSQAGWGNALLQINPSKPGILGDFRPQKDVLNRVMGNLAQTQQTESPLKERLELRFSSVLEPESCLENLPTDLLKSFERILNHAVQTSQMPQRYLTEYRDQLTAFDQTIAQYQQMLDGKASLPQGLTMEQVQSMLDLTKESRDSFLREGAQALSRSNQYLGSLAEDSLLGRISQTVSGSTHDYTGKGSDFWEIDPDAEDIYAEIDRVLEASRAVSDHYGQGVTAIRAELKRRGELSSYQDYFAQEKPQENSEPSSLMQQLLSQTWEQFFEKSKEIFSSH